MESERCPQPAGTALKEYRDRCFYHPGNVRLSAGSLLKWSCCGAVGHTGTHFREPGDETCRGCVRGKHKSKRCETYAKLADSGEMTHSTPRECGQCGEMFIPCISIAEAAHERNEADAGLNTSPDSKGYD